MQSLSTALYHAEVIPIQTPHVIVAVAVLIQIPAMIAVARIQMRASTMQLQQSTHELISHGKESSGKAAEGDEVQGEGPSGRAGDKDDSDA